MRHAEGSGNHIVDMHERADGCVWGYYCARCKDKGILEPTEKEMIEIVVEKVMNHEISFYEATKLQGEWYKTGTIPCPECGGKI